MTLMKLQHLANLSLTDYQMLAAIRRMDGNIERLGPLNKLICTECPIIKLQHLANMPLTNRQTLVAIRHRDGNMER